MSIARTVVVAQGKGGVGKTSLTSNLAGLAAAAGHRVLLLDLDQQGNVARDLGYEPDTGDDLMSALISSTAPLPVRKGVRERLDVVPGGPAVGDVAAVFAGRASRGGEDLGTVLHRKLETIASDYDLILMDTPPGDRIIVDAALQVSRSVVIPTRPDDASIDGVSRIAERFVAVREQNPDLRLAGIALFAIASRTTRLERDVRTILSELVGDAAPVFETRVRHLDSAAADARRRGLLIHELEAAGSADRSARIRALRAGEKPTDGLYSRDASGLASDYEALAHELLLRVAEIEQEAAVTA